MTYVTCDICDDISGPILSGSMLIVVIAEYAMDIILVTETIYLQILRLPQLRMRFFLQIQYFHTASAKSRVENISHRQNSKFKFI